MPHYFVGTLIVGAAAGSSGLKAMCAGCCAPPLRLGFALARDRIFGDPRERRLYNLGADDDELFVFCGVLVCS